MSLMSSDISEESKLDECAAGAVSSASNVCVDDVYEKSSPLLLICQKLLKTKHLLNMKMKSLCLKSVAGK